jgi:hypothetical protein
MTETTNATPTTIDLDAIEARANRFEFLAPGGSLFVNKVELTGRDDLEALAALFGKDVPALLAEVKRLGARWKSSQYGVGELIDRAENVEYRHEQATAEITVLRAALDRLVDAADDVLAEAEQAETDAVAKGADPGYHLLSSLKELRFAILAVPADAAAEREATS